jgi:probable HAF family extracellular repeat protein
MHWTRGFGRVGALAAVIAGLAVAPLGGGGAAAETSARPRQLEVVDLGTLPGHSQSEALGINDRGTVVGWSLDGTTGLTRAVRWDDEAISELGSLIGPSGTSAATAVNRRGDIAGYSSASEEDISVIHPVLWQDGEPIDLGTREGPSPRR